MNIVVVVGGFERILGLKKYILLLDLETRKSMTKVAMFLGFVIVVGLLLDFFL